MLPIVMVTRRTTSRCYWSAAAPERTSDVIGVIRPASLPLNLHPREREDDPAGRWASKRGCGVEGGEDQHVLQLRQNGLGVLGSREDAVVLNPAIGPDVRFHNQRFRIAGPHRQNKRSEL